MSLFMHKPFQPKLEIVFNRPWPCLCSNNHLNLYINLIIAEENNKEEAIHLNNVHCHSREEWMTIRDGSITVSVSDVEGNPLLLIPGPEQHDDDYLDDDDILTEK